MFSSLLFLGLIIAVVMLHRRVKALERAAVDLPGLLETINLINPADMTDVEAAISEHEDLCTRLYRSSETGQEGPCGTKVGGE